MMIFEDDLIGIVCPIYSHIPPQIVQDFLKKATFQIKYFFMIETYGNHHSGSAEYAADICKKCGIDVNYINTIKMVDNYLPSFDMEEQMKIDKKIDEQIDKILKDVSERKNEIPKATAEEIEYHKNLEAINSKMIPKLYIW